LPALDLRQYPLEVLWITILAPADQAPDRSKLLPALEYWPGAEMHELGDYIVTDPEYLLWAALP
jgi:hypothetical protein